MSAGGIFDNLGALRLAADAAAPAETREVLSHVSVRRPGRQEWVRVHPDPAMSLAAVVFVDKEERDEVFFVTPEMRDAMAGEGKPVLLVTAVTRQGAAFLWPLGLPGPDGRTNPWWETAREAAEEAKSKWVRVASDRALGAYRIYIAEGKLSDPVWPDVPLSRLLELGFRDRVIAGEDHPIAKRLRGEA
jgi:hypothetical protein